MRYPKNSSEIYKMYSEYKDLNRDIAKHYLNQMVVFYLASKIRKDRLNEFFDHDFGTTPRYHRPWFWWQTFKYSGIGTEWDQFATDHNSGKGLRECLRELRDRIPFDKWNTLSRRHGYTRRLKPSWWQPSKTTTSLSQRLWSKGGTWSLPHSMTQLIVLKKHLPLRESTKPSRIYLMETGSVRRLESEIMSVFHPDSALVPETLMRAVQYAQRRIKELLGWVNKNPDLYQVSWFFQCMVPDEQLYFHDWESEGLGMPLRKPQEEQRWIWW